MNDSQLGILIYEAIHTLNIDVPIVSSRVVGSQVELFLYGGRVILYPPDDRVTDRVTESVADVNHPAVRDLSAMELSTLRDLATRKGVPGAKKMSRRQLTEALKAAR